MQWQLPKVFPGSSDAAAEEKRPSPSSTFAACAAMLPSPSPPFNGGGAVAVVVVPATTTIAAAATWIRYTNALALQLLRLRLVALVVATALLLECCGAALLVHKYSTRVVRTKYGPLRGVMVHVHPPVEAFLGVPYATPPVGSLRFMPPVTPSLWKNTRLADRFSPVCPQKPPDIGNRTEALLDYPRGRLLYLEKLLPLLANQSEDCLYLNLYVPRTETGEEEPIPVPCIVYVHGESFEWNSGNPYDGTVLASSARVIVVTINFRLGVLGFLKTGTKGSAQGNFGLMDLVAGLHWLRENLPAFGGDPERVTLMGHGTGAALVNYIAVSPVAKELLHRVILLSGSGLSPWALQRDPLFVKRKVAEQTGCHGDLLEDDLAPCLRLKPLSQLLCITIDPPRFLPGFAPFIDGTILLNPAQSHSSASLSSSSSSSSSSTVATSAGFELADFPDRNLLIGVTSTESYLDLSAQDLEFGFNESRRDRILRTYVRNCYYYHLNEIFSTLKNEYTDWERPSQNPLSVRDGTLDVLSDGHTVSPLIRVGYLHALRGGHTYVMHFQHQTGERDFPQRGGSVRGEDIPYALGLPLVNGGAFFPHNYSHIDILTSKTLLHYLGNFARKGDPNGAVPSISGDGGISIGSSSSSAAAAAASAAATAAAAAAGIVPPGSSSAAVRSYTTSVSSSNVHAPFWDTYDTINQLYLELGNKAEMKSHYRGHKMSLWLNLIPQLHRAAGDGDDLSMRHHHFQEEGDQYYDGSVRPQTMQKPTLVHLVPPPTITTTTTTTTTKSPPTLITPTILSTTSPTPHQAQQPPKAIDPSLQPQGSTECPPNNTYLLSSTKGGANGLNNNNLLRKLAASNHYQSYTTALTVTIAVGCFLLLLNVLIFAGIYHQRDRSKGREGGKNKRKKKEEMLEGGGGAGGSCSSSSGEGYDSKSSLYDPRPSGVTPGQVGVVGYQVKAAGGYSGSSYDCKQLPTYIGQYGCEKYGLAEMQMTQLALQEFQSSPPSGMKRNSETTILMTNCSSTSTSNHPPPDVTTTIAPHLITSSCKESQTTSSGSDVTSPSSIPEPPPPPKSQPPTATSTGAPLQTTQSQQTQCPVGGGAGILRSSSTHGSGGPTSTPGTMKKRVQIQEISV